MCFSIACKWWMLNVTLYQNWYVHCRQFSVGCGTQYNAVKSADIIYEICHLDEFSIWQKKQICMYICDRVRFEHISYLYCLCSVFQTESKFANYWSWHVCVCVSLCYRILQENDNIKWWLHPVTAFVPFAYCYVIAQPQWPVDSRFSGRKRLKNYVYQHLECIDVSQIEFRLFVKNPSPNFIWISFFIHRFLDAQ